MKKKITKKILPIALASLVSVACFSGCGGGQGSVPDTEETLEIYMLDAGYKTDWLQPALDLFKEQDWVKDKYPNLVVASPVINDVVTFAESKLEAGKSGNTFDLIFMGHLPYGLKGSGSGSKGAQLADLTESVYEATVPGEDVKFIDKMYASFVESVRYNNPSDSAANGRFYSIPWAGGMESFTYNETILNSLGIEVPRTTDELAAACAYIKSLEGNTEGKYDKGYSFIQSKDAKYWDDFFGVWWAQYNGIDGYYDFYNGIDGNRYSKNIFKQKGILKSIEVYENLLDYQKGWLTPSSHTYEFMEAQTLYLQGNGVFHVNGDWFPSEMALIQSQIPESQRQTIKMMPMPILSDIIELTPTINDDITLSAVVKAIDEGQSSYGTVSQADFDKIKEARSIVFSIGPRHEALVPSYANGKNVAIDFLRFLATDMVQDIYLEKTLGANLPFYYDVEVKNEALFNSLAPLHQERLRYFNSTTNPINVLPNSKAFPLNMYGGVEPTVNHDYYINLSLNNRTRTAQSYIDETVAAWTDEKWADALMKAGLN